MHVVTSSGAGPRARRRNCSAKNDRHSSGADEAGGQDQAPHEALGAQRWRGTLSTLRRPAPGQRAEAPLHRARGAVAHDGRSLGGDRDDRLGGAGPSVVAVRGLHPKRQRVVEGGGGEADPADHDGDDQDLQRAPAAVDREAEGGVGGREGEREPEPAVEREGDRDDRRQQHQWTHLAPPPAVPAEPAQDEEGQVERDVVAPGVGIGERGRRARLDVAEEVAGGWPATGAPGH